MNTISLAGKTVWWRRWQRGFQMIPNTLHISEKMRVFIICKQYNGRQRQLAVSRRLFFTN